MLDLRSKGNFTNGDKHLKNHLLEMLTDKKLKCEVKKVLLSDETMMGTYYTTVQSQSKILIC